MVSFHSLIEAEKLKERLIQDEKRPGGLANLPSHIIRIKEIKPCLPLVQEKIVKSALKMSRIGRCRDRGQWFPAPDPRCSMDGSQVCRAQHRFTHPQATCSFCCLNCASGLSFIAWPQLGIGGKDLEDFSLMQPDASNDLADKSRLMTVLQDRRFITRNAYQCSTQFERIFLEVCSQGAEVDHKWSTAFQMAIKSK